MQSVCSKFVNGIWFCNSGLFGANWVLKFEEGICNAIGRFKFSLLSLCDSVNCDAITGEKIECGKWDATDLIFTCNFLLFDIGVCSVNGLIGFEKDDFNFKMLFRLCFVDRLF